MEYQKATKYDLLAKFIKPNESDWLKGAEADAKDELDRMRAIKASNGTEISSQKRWEVKKLETEEVKISFCLTRPMRDAEDGDMANAEEAFGLNETDDRLLTGAWSQGQGHCCQCHRRGQSHRHDCEHTSGQLGLIVISLKQNVNISTISPWANSP